MTIGEFKAWLDGFNEAMGSSPNIKQWKKIQERLETVYESETWTPWWPRWYYDYNRPLVYGGNESSSAGWWQDWQVNTVTTGNTGRISPPTNYGNNVSGDTISVMYCSAAKEIGQREAEELSH